MLSCLTLSVGLTIGLFVAGMLGLEVGVLASTGGLLLSLTTLLLGRLGGSLLTGVDGAATTAGLAVGTGAALLLLAGVGGPFAWKDLARALTMEPPLGAGSGGPDCFDDAPGLGGALPKADRPPGPGRGGRLGPPVTDILYLLQ